MGMIAASVGEDDGSSAGDSGGESSGGSGSSGNSGLIRKHGRTPAAATRAKGPAEKQRHTAGTAYEKAKAKPRGEAKPARKVKLQPLATDAKPKKKSAMTRHFSGYGTLKSTKSEPPADDSSASSWKSNVDKWSQEAHQLLSPRGNARVKKQVNGASRSHSRSKANFRNALQSDESGEDSETSTSSFSSSYSDSPVAIPIRSSSFSAADRWEAKLLVAKPKSSKVAEELPLLRPVTHEWDTDIECGSLLDEPESDAHPEIRVEVRKLFKLAYPVIFTYVLEFFPELVSMTLVGHLDSPLTKQYLDGVALSTMCMNLTAIGVGFGLATAMDTLCSQAYGAGKPKKLGIYLQSGLIVLTLVLIPISVVNWYTEACLIAIGQPAEVAAFAGRFSKILLPGIPAMYVYEMLKKVMQAQNVVMPMVYIAVISNLVNIVLGIYLTFYTSLGFDGAAIARLLSEMLLPFCLIPYYLRNPHIPAEWWPGWQLKQAISHLGIFMQLGLPAMMMMLLEWWSFEIMAAIVGWLPNSVVAISVHSVMVNVSTFAFNFFLGISVAANVLVGNYSGMNKPHHAKMASTLGMVLSVSLSAVLAVVIIATRYYIPEIFINDAVSIGLAGHALLFLMPYQMCDAINAVMQGVFRGTGRLALGAYINLFAYFVVGLPVGVYLAFRQDMGVEGMWLGLTAGIFGGCVVSFVKICETDWKRMADAARVRTN